jgi:hypothetical protein
MPRFTHTEKDIRGFVAASTAGREAYHQGKKLDANPYDENDERHWRWLNAWANEGMERMRRTSPQNENSPSVGAKETKP